MITFRVYFSDGTVQLVDAVSGTQARYLAGDIAKTNGVFVKKIKVNRG